MRVITGRGVNQIWDMSRKILNEEHIVRPSRVGEVWEYPSLVVSEFLNPLERVLFSPERNANPFFHLFEAIFMLAGCNELSWLEKYNSKISEFVGKDPLIDDSYGYRLRKAFDLDGGAEDDYADQFKKVIQMLRKNHDERRAVLCMWNPLWDLDRPDKASVPCNTHIYLKIRDGKLTQTVCCRSNDLQLGCLGANVVHMSMFQEYLAACIGVEVGTYWQVSDSWHAYTSRWESLGGLSTKPTRDHYAEGVKPYPLVNDPKTFDDELKQWMEESGDSLFFKNSFFSDVAEPLKFSWDAYKKNDLELAKLHLAYCHAEDWRIACIQWLERVEAKRANKVNQSASL